MTPSKALIALILLMIVKAPWVFAAAMEYAPSPPDNPLKGLVPYAGQAKSFPHSMEFNYLALKDLMTGRDEFRWEPLDRLIEEISKRGCQAVFRVVLEHSNRPSGIPQFLIDGGLKVHTNDDPESKRKTPRLTPDYEDPRLRQAMKNFIAALGRRYDGDPRVGFITAGLLGNWGEWHTHPFKQLWASKAVQREVMDAYQGAFKKTPILLRYPAGEEDPVYAANADRPLGYHDDSFVWATLATGRKSDSWFFMDRMQRAGKPAMEKWKNCPVGGEIRPEAWDGLWNEKSATPAGQEFAACVEQTHATWLMDSSITRKLDPQQRERATAGARRLGYEFFVQSVEITLNEQKSSLAVIASVANKGVAPFYYDWPIELVTMDAKGQLIATWQTDWKLTGMIPNDPARHWKTRVDLKAIPLGRHQLLLRVSNPMPGGKPLRFANRTQDQHLPGYLTLGQFER